MTYSKNAYKIYSCVVSTGILAIQHTIDNIVYGYTIMGDKIVKFIFDSDNINFKGCFLNENQKIHLSQNDNINSSIVNKICKKSKLKIIDIMYHGLDGVSPMIQQFAIKGPFNVDLNNQTANIFDAQYNVNLVSKIFTLKGETSFLGLNGNHCSIQYLRDHILNKAIEDVSTVYLKSAELVSDNIMDFSNKLLIEDKIDKSTGEKLLIGFLASAGVVVCAGGYALYKYYKYESEQMIEAENVELMEISINNPHNPHDINIAGNIVED